MDAGHRHELKTNELAEGLAHLPELIKQNPNTIVGVLLIAIALITWPLFSKMSRQKQLAEDTSTTQAIQALNQDVYHVLKAPADDVQAKTEALNTMLVNADSLLEKASEIDNPNLAATAQIKAAQAIRTELHLRPEVDAETLDSQIQKAKDAYQKALEQADLPTVKAMALLGLGLCSEELGQTDQAAEIYQQIVDDESYTPTVAAAQAQQRLDGLKDNIETFTFADVPVAAEPPAAENTEAATPSQEPAESAVSAPAVPETTPDTAQETPVPEKAPEPQTNQP